MQTSAGAGRLTVRETTVSGGYHFPFFGFRLTIGIDIIKISGLKSNIITPNL